MGYLDELKRQADEALAQQTQRHRRAAAQCAAHRRRLPADFALPRQLARSSTCCSRCRRRSGASTAEHSFRQLRLPTSARLAAAKKRATRRSSTTSSSASTCQDRHPGDDRQGLPARDREARGAPRPVRRAATTARSSATRRTAASSRSASSSRPTSTAVVRMLPDHDTGLDPVPGRQPRRLRDGDGAVFPAFEVGSQRLDELARWIVGEPNGFLRDGQHLRRVEY